MMIHQGVPYIQILISNLHLLSIDSSLQNSTIRVMLTTYILQKLDHYSHPNYHLIDLTSFRSALPFIAGHHMYKRITDSSLLGGSCILSSFVPLQMICEVNGKIQMLHQNVSHSYKGYVRPIRLWAVPEDTGQFFQPLQPLITNQLKFIYSEKATKFCEIFN